MSSHNPSLMPPHDPLPASVRRELDALWREVKFLRRKADKDAVRLREREIVFTFAGAPAAGRTPPYHVRDTTGTIVRADIAVQDAGTSQTSIAIYVSGTSEATITLDANDGYEVWDGLAIDIEAYDKVWVDLTSVGAGVQDITVSLTYLMDHD